MTVVQDPSVRSFDLLHATSPNFDVFHTGSDKNNVSFDVSLLYGGEGGDVYQATIGQATSGNGATCLLHHCTPALLS